MDPLDPVGRVKRCSKCNADLPEEEFYDRAASADQHQAWCIGCKRDYMREYMRSRRAAGRA